jgi:hypothetical protein
MDPREELTALRRLAELEARAGGVQTAPSGQIPGAAPGQVAPATAPQEPETTTAGVSGAMTRALALPVAGATAGRIVGGAPGALAGMAAGTLAPAVADPLVSLFNRAFGTNVQQPSEALGQLLTRMGVPVPRSGAEKFTGQMTAGVTAGTALPAQFGRTAAAMAQGTRAAPVVTPIAEAVRVGGMGPTGGATMGQRVGAGMTAGTIGAVPTAEGPIDVAVGGTMGGLFPPVAKAGKEVVSGLWDATVMPLMRPAIAAERQMYRAVGGTPGAAERTIAEIEAGRQVPTTPGFQPTLPELVVAGGGEAPPTLAVLAERVRGATPEQARDIQRLVNERVGALQAQLARVNQQIDQQGATLQPGALDELTQARDSILRNLEDEQNSWESVLRTAAGRLPEGPQAAGTSISQRTSELQEAFKKTEVDPRYTKALQLGGDVPNIDATSIAQAVESIYRQPLSSFAPTTAPRVVGILQRLQATRGPDEPVTTTLKVMHDLRKAINLESRAASQAGNGDLAYNLGRLQNAVDDAIDGAPALPDDAKTAYKAATAFYRDIYAPRFREGVTGKILRPTTFGETRIMPSDVVNRFTSSTDDAKQFITTFAGDAQAFESLRNGILGQFRRAAVDARTGLVKPNEAASFLQNNAEQFAVLDNAGLGIRRALQQFEQDAVQGNEALTSLKAIGKGFEGTPDEVLEYILGSGDRMGIALNRSDAQGRDAIRRVVQTRLNQMLTQTPGGEPLTESGVMSVVKEITDPTGKLKPAYEKALGRTLATEFADRAKGLRLVIETGKDPMLKNPNAIEPILRAQNFTPAQLTDIQLVIDDLARANKVSEAARAARASARPSGRDVLGEELEGGTVRPDKLNLLNRGYTFFRNMYLGARDRLNPKISAQLANMIYNNPDAAVTALRNEIARAQRKAAPAGISRAAPGYYGAQSSAISSEVVDVLRPEEQQPQQPSRPRLILD